MTRTTMCFILLGLITSHSLGDEPRPNILFVVCDDLNTHVSPTGYAPIQTPTLDALAAEAMTFHRAYCQYPVCGPSRASFLHGLYPESTGVLDNNLDIRNTRPGTVSLPEWFKRRGYWTASVGKVFHSPRHELGEVAWNEFQRFENDELPVIEDARRQFELEYGDIDSQANRRAWRTLRSEILAPLNAQTPPGHGGSGLADHQHKDGKNARQVVAWIQEESFGDQPFFICLGIQKPHVPFLAPDQYFDQYPLASLRLDHYPENLWENLPRDAMSGRYDAFGFELGVEDDELRREYMQAYHACISFLDAQISLVIDSLKTNGYWDNTIIIFTSDHGYHLGEHFMWGKVTLFDIGTRVPFIVRVPGMTQPGSTSNAMVELVDVYPTLAELANLPLPNHLQGRSLVPTLENPQIDGPRDFAYTVVRRRDDLGYAIRNQQWRYTHWPSGGEELYDLNLDPLEVTNLASDEDYLEITQHLRELLREKQDIARSNHVDSKPQND